MLEDSFQVRGSVFFLLDRGAQVTRSGSGTVTVRSFSSIAPPVMSLLNANPRSIRREAANVLDRVNPNEFNLNRPTPIDR